MEWKKREKEERKKRERREKEERREVHRNRDIKAEEKVTNRNRNRVTETELKVRKVRKERKERKKRKERECWSSFQPLLQCVRAVLTSFKGICAQRLWLLHFLI